MKKNFRFMLLGLLAMSSMSVFADKIDETARSCNNVLYRLVSSDDGKTHTATVVGVNPAATDDAVKTIVIPAAVTGEAYGENAYKVIGISVGWASAYSQKDVTGITETLIIDAANFANNTLSNSFAYLKKLKNLTISENKDGKALVAFPTFFDNTQIENLDIAGSVNITAVADDKFNGGKLKSIKLSSKLKTIGNNAFKDCADLTAFDFGENLETIGKYAFSGSGLTAADLSKTKLTEINNGVFSESKVATASLPKTVTKLQWYAFYKAPLATLTLEDAGTLKMIKQYALAYTKLTEFTLIANDPENEVYIDENAFYGCTKLKTFNFTGAAYDDYDFDGDFDWVDFDAFVGIPGLVTITAPQEYIDNYGTAPRNCKWEAKEAPIKVDGKITLKGKDGAKFAKWFHNTKVIAVDADKYKVFSVYVDNGDKKKDGTAYFQGLKRVNNRYYIWQGEHVIFQAVDPEVTEVEYEDMTLKTSIADFCVLIDHIFTFAEDYTLADFQTHNAPNYYGLGYYNGADYFVYRLTNNNGIQFSLFTGDTMKGGYDDGTTDTCDKAQFFIQSLRKPDASGRLNVIWLDEDGNVIGGDATAIEEVKTTQEDGAVYNLAGQKVNNSYKGVVIQNGKKYMK